MEGKFLLGDSVLSGSEGRFKWDKRSDGITHFSQTCAFTGETRVERVFLPGRIQLVKDRVILQNEDLLQDSEVLHYLGNVLYPLS